jgi:hypothetical protein
MGELAVARTLDYLRASVTVLTREETLDEIGRHVLRTTEGRHQLVGSIDLAKGNRSSRRL